MSITDQLTAAIQDKTWTSESDEGFTVIQFGHDEPFTLQEDVQNYADVFPDNVRTQSIDDAFEDQDDLDDLEAALRTLKAPQVFFVATDDAATFDVYLVGFDGGQVVGVKTTAVET